jgi:predicted RNA-binding protein with PUA-like domain
MKSEPSTFSISDLKKRNREHWDGVRNFQARNFMKAMNLGDECFFYHSSCPDPGIYGLMKVAQIAYPDHTQFDPTSKYYDEKSTPAKPRWYMVDVEYKKTLKKPILLSHLKHNVDLGDFPLLRRGNRLSIMPVTVEQWHHILSLSL